MIVYKDSLCPYKPEFRNHPKDMDDDLVWAYTDGMVAFFGMWEYVSHLCSQMAEGVCIHDLNRIDFDPFRGRDKSQFIWVGNKKKQLQVSEIVYNNLKTLQEEAKMLEEAAQLAAIQNQVKVPNAIRMLEIEEDMREFPKFASFTSLPDANKSKEDKVRDGTKVRYIGNRKYYRDAGEWTINVMWKGDILVCSDRKGHLAHAYGHELVECSREEWANDNSGYVPAHLENECDDER